MSSTPPSDSPRSNNTLKIVLMVVAVFVVVCVVLPLCIIAVLSIFAPSITNVFSHVTNGLSAPIN